MNAQSIKTYVLCPIPNSISCSYFLISISYFPKEMPCQRIDCAQCLTMLALKNDAPGVNHFLSKVDKSKPFDPYVVIPSDAIRTWVIEGWNGPKDDGQIREYLLTDSADAHLMFQEVITQHPISQHGYEYHISPFYMVIKDCRWITPHIISSIIN
ncbi:MAG: hypothetical protein FD143_3697, partial [Ignavibacteria bacterium]